MNLINRSTKGRGLKKAKSKLNNLMTVVSIKITFYLSTNLTSSSVRSLIILLIEGVIGYSSFAAIIVTVVIRVGSYAIFASCELNNLGEANAKNLSIIFTPINRVSSL